MKNKILEKINEFANQEKVVKVRNTVEEKIKKISEIDYKNEISKKIDSLKDRYKLD